MGMSESAWSTSAVSRRGQPAWSAAISAGCTGFIQDSSVSFGSGKSKRRV